MLHVPTAKALAALGAASLATAPCGTTARSAVRPPRPAPTTTPAADAARGGTRALPPGSCHASSLDPATTRPDPHCTPGALNPDVTQANIHRTICVAGYTKRIRPPVSYTNALKRRQIKEYGYRNTDPSAYEEDHFVPLSLGGAPRDPKNLWPEPGASPNPKDRVEFTLYKAVCAGQATLAAAQRAIVEDWTTATRILR
ncbi:hypothetical protein DZF91_33370 [Actinomadura logoneensis]|uniref:HNH endonuclease n=1 Tax=Actinomadura logoneensis TaxID=2293572 RepID=A0A372JBF3_9ACTN|nr:hypothetical protein [Actinomadura logoneensis]RFU37337.1 hypothetical protein DZF91_33370 [Actinomadura logoneensis]